MLDDRSGSVWSHLDGAALSGVHEGTRLAVLPLQTTTWGAWREEHPDTTVLDPDTGYRYRGLSSLGRGGLSQTFEATLDTIDDRLPINELVIGVLAGSEAAAFRIESIRDQLPVQSELGGVPLVILASPDGDPSLAYHRALNDGRVLDFERSEDGAARDVQTGSRWTSDGRAVEGELAGVQLTFVTSFLSEWYGWAAFNPDTRIEG